MQSMTKGFPLLEFLPEFTSWEEYLEYMSRCNTFGNQTTLFAAANLYNVNIQVISTLGPGAQHLFEPSSSTPLATVYLGHFAQGEHYVSLMPWFILKIRGLNAKAEVATAEMVTTEVGTAEMVMAEVVRTKVEIAKIEGIQVMAAEVTGT